MASPCPYDLLTFAQESEDVQLSVGRSVPWSLEDAYVAFMNHEKRPLRLDRFKGISSARVCVCVCERLYVRAFVLVCAYVCVFTRARMCVKNMRVNESTLEYRGIIV